MPLDDRKLDIKALLRELADEPATRTVHIQLDADGGVQSSAAGGDIHQAGDNENVYPPGFFCKQTADDEEIKLKCDANWVIIAVNVSQPSDVQAARVREPVLWDPTGNRIRCNGADGAEVTVADGLVLKIRTADANTKPMAYAGSEEGDTKSSHVATGTALDAWTHQVMADMADIKADLSTLRTLLNLVIVQVNKLTGWSQLAAFLPASWAAPGISTALALSAMAALTLTPDTTDGLNKDEDHSYVSSGTDKGEIEPEEAP